MLASLLLIKIAHAETIQVGISPTRIYAEHLLRGSHFEKEILLSKSLGNEDLYVEITTTSPWIAVDKNKTFIFSKDVQAIPLVFEIDIPFDAELGYYEHTISVAVKPIGYDGFTTELAFPIDVKINLTDKENIDYSVSYVKIPDIEEDKPITILLTVDNRGNVQAKPEKVDVELLDKFKTQTFQKTTHNNLEYVAPFTKEDIIVEVPHSLEPEQYAAKITAYGDNGILEENIIFDVLPKKSMPNAILGFLAILLFISFIFLNTRWKQ